MAVWLDPLHALRNRWLSSPRFQRWAAAFPLTRPIAQRQARALFDLTAGFVYTQVLLACVELDLFERLREGPQTAAAVGAQVGLATAVASRLLEAAVALGLIARRGEGRYGLGLKGAALLGNPGVSAMIRHHALLYADLADPVARLKAGSAGSRLSAFWAYAGGGAADGLVSEAVADYSELMAVSQALVAEDVLDAYDVSRHRRLLDVGGGDGAFLMAAAQRAPALRLTLFDVPAVADRAAARLAAAGLSARATAIGGDFRDAALPTGADLVSLVRIALDHDDATVVALLRAVAAALEPGGRVLIAEPLADTPGAEPVGAAYFGLYLFVMGRGRPRSAFEIKQLLTAAGFSSVRAIRTRRPMLTGLVTGVRGP